MCPAQDHFIVLMHIVDVCPLSDPDVGPSVFV